MDNFIQKLEKLAKVQDRIIRRSASVAEKFSKERFVRKNWVDRTRVPWKKRKRKNNGSLLVLTGRLKKSVRVLHVGTNYAIIGTDVPYARIHNDGGKIQKTVRVRAHRRRVTRGRGSGVAKVKSHTRNMNLKIPARQFIGESAVLNRRIERQLERDINEALK